MKKRLLPISLLMVLALAACTPSQPSSEPEPSTPSSSEPSSEVVPSQPSSEEEPSEPSSEEEPSSEHVALMLDVYFDKPADWADTVNIYLWGDAGQAVAWPGTAMENLGEGLYKYNYDVNLYPNVIFNDGSNQTADLKSPTDADLARFDGENWVETERPTPEPEVTMSITNKDELTAEWHLGDEPRTIAFEFEPAININSAILNEELVITSSNPEAVAVNGRAIQAIAVADDVTITATYKETLTDSFQVSVLDEVGMPITALEDVWAGLDDGTLKVGDEVRIQGIVASTMQQVDGHIHAGVYLQNGEVPMPLYAGGLGAAWLELDLQVGDAIDVTGKIDVFNGLTQVKPNAVDGVKKLTSHNIAAPVALELTGDNFNATDLAHEAGRLVNVEEAVYVGGKIDAASSHATINFNLTKENGDLVPAGFRYNYHAGTEAGTELKAVIDALNPGDKVSLKGTLLWFNGPQITPTFSATFDAGECVTFLSAGELPAPTSFTVKGNAEVEVGATAQYTVEANEGADISATWASSDETVATVNENGLVTALKEGTTTIKATSKKAPGVFGELEVTVVASKEPAPIAVATLAEALNHSAAEMTQKFTIKNLEVVGWQKETDTAPSKYGNITVTDGTTTILSYGSTATASALTWDASASKYTYKNAQDFLTNELTSKIVIGSVVDLTFVVTSYNSNKQLNSIVTNVVNEGGDTPVEPETPTDPEVPAGETATFAWDEGVKQESYSTTQAVYSHNGVTLTNDKASSTTNIRDCKNDKSLRVYKNSNLTISTEEEFAKVVITFDSYTYGDDYYYLNDGELDASVDGLAATFTLEEAANSFLIQNTVRQLRIKSVTVYFA